MIWLLLLAVSCFVGLLRLPRWTVLVAPIASVGVGVYAVADEPANYDMHGFGYAVGGLAAVLCVVAWLLGRALAAIAYRRA